MLGIHASTTFVRLSSLQSKVADLQVLMWRSIRAHAQWFGVECKQASNEASTVVRMFVTRDHPSRRALREIASLLISSHRSLSFSLIGALSLSLCELIDVQQPGAQSLERKSLGLAVSDASRSRHSVRPTPFDRRAISWSIYDVESRILVTHPRGCTWLWN